MARRTKHRPTRAEQTWRRIVEEWRGSGLTAREFCEKNGLKTYKTLHVWSSKLNKLDANPTPGGEFVSSAFVPVEVIHNDEETANVEVEPETIDVYLACGDAISIPRGSDMQQVAQVVAILRKESQ